MDNETNKKSVFSSKYDLRGTASKPGERVDNINLRPLIDEI